MKIIAFCNIQFICHLLHEKSLTLPNWFCPSFFPPRGPQIPGKIWPAISAYLHLTPAEEKNCGESNSGMSRAGDIITASVLNISRQSFTCSNKHCRQNFWLVTWLSKHVPTLTLPGTVWSNASNIRFSFSLFSGYSCQIQDQVKDVVEGADVVLECRFSPSLSGTEGTLYWIRSSANQHDNVAIGDTPYSTGYTWVQHCRPPLSLLRC